MNNYIKIIDNNMVYYIKKDFKSIDISRGARHLMLQSDFVIDKNKNELIKCRESIEELIEHGIKGIHEFHKNHELEKSILRMMNKD